MPVHEQSEKCVELVNFTQPVIAQANANFGLFWAILLWIYYIGCLTFYAIRRQHSYYLQARLFGFICISTLHLCYENTWALREFIGRENYPCFLSQISILVAFSFGLIPVVIRTLIYYRRVAFSKAAAQDMFFKELKQGYVRLTDTDNNNENDEDHEPRDDVESQVYEKMSSQVSTKPDSRRGLGSVRKIIGSFAGGSEDRKNLSLVNITSKNVFSEDDMESILEQSTTNNLAILTKSEKKRREAKESREVRKMKWKRFAGTATFGWIIWGISTGIFLVLMYLAVERAYDCWGCETLDSRASEFTTSTIMLCVFVGIAFIAFYQIRNEPDPLGKRKELGTTFIVLMAGSVFWVIFDAADIGNLYREGRIYWGYLLEAAFAATYFVMVPYQIYLSYGFDKAIDEQNVLGKALPSFEVVMESQVLKNQFKTYLVTEQCLESYLFWNEVRNWEKWFDRWDKIDRADRFVFIYNCFINTKTATFQINIGAHMRAPMDQIAEQLAANLDVQIDRDVFTVAKVEIQDIISFGPFFRFLRSPYYDDKGLH